MPFVNDPEKPGQFDPLYMTREEQEAYGKVAGRLFLLAEAVRELEQVYSGTAQLGGAYVDFKTGIQIEWRIAEKK